MKSVILLALVLSVPTIASANIGKQVEMWCGAPSHGSPTAFPYMASIRTYTSKKHHGKHFEVATVYRHGKIVAKNYVYKASKGMGMSYISPDNDFALNLSTQSSLDSTADFRAVIHQKGGDTMIANGEFPCHRPKS